MGKDQGSTVPEGAGTYIKFRKSGSGAFFNRFNMAETVEGLAERAPSAEKKDADTSVRLGADKHASFPELMRGYYSAIIVFYRMLPSISFVAKIIAEVSIDKELYGYCHANGKQISDNENEPVYFVSLSKTSGLNAKLELVSQMFYGANQFDQMLLSGAVTSYDSYFAGLLRLVFNNRPALVSSSGVNMGADELMTIENVSEIHQRLRERKIEGLMHGSHFDQLKYLDDVLGMEMKSKYQRFGDLIEIFERRNVFVHADGVATRLYVEKCKAASLIIPNDQIGKRLVCDEEYIRKSVDVLMDAGVRLIAVCWHKLFKDDVRDICRTVNEISMFLISHGYNRAASWILEGMLERFQKTAPVDLRMMMVVNLANAYKKMNQADQMESALAREDWTVSSESFKICVASIKEDVDEVIKRLPIVRMTGEIGIEDIIEWPAFDAVRSHEAFVAAVESEFGAAPRRLMYTRTDETTVGELPSGSKLSDGVGGESA